MPKTRFSEDEASRALAFFPKYLAFSKGPFGGKRFDLKPWQEDIIRPIFGRQVYDAELKQWVREIRTAYVEIPRKNGKTELGAGIALKLLYADGENGAEIYSVAEDLDQANKVFAAAQKMVDSNPHLSAKAKVYKRLIEHENGGIYRIIPGDAAGNHGHNPSGVIFDELHTQKTGDLWDVMTSGGGTRAQPLTVAFSTAGTDRESICWEQHEYGERLAKAILKDPRFFYVRYGIAEGEDWEDREVWRRCNPALGEFLLTSYLEDKYLKAKSSPARQNSFRNLYLNEWTQQAVRWLDMGVWDGSAGMVAEPDLRTHECYGGLWIGGTSDLAAWCLCFPEDGKIKVLLRCFVPRSAVANDKAYGPMFQEWEQRGLLTVTDGNVVDYPRIREEIIADAGRFDLKQINLRVTFKGSETATTLADLFGSAAVLYFTPSFNRYAFPTTELERLLGLESLHHGGHPILRWAADNVVVRRNANGDVMPDPEASQGSIAPIVALLMALDLLATDESVEPLFAWV